MARWEVLRCLFYSRPGERVRALGSEPPQRWLPRPRPHTMPCPRLLAALCGALFCASGLFAFSGELIAPPSRPRPSSPRRSEVRRRALPLPPLFTNLVQEPGLSRGTTSPAAPGRAAGMLSASPAGGGGLVGARGLSVGLGLGTLGDSPASPREVAYTEQRNPLCRASVFPSVQ